MMMFTNILILQMSGKISDKEITERCILVLLNEAVWALEERYY